MGFKRMGLNEVKIMVKVQNPLEKDSEMRLMPMKEAINITGQWNFRKPDCLTQKDIDCLLAILNLGSRIQYTKDMRDIIATYQGKGDPKKVKTIVEKEIKNGFEELKMIKEHRKEINDNYRGKI